MTAARNSRPAERLKRRRYFEIHYRILIGLAGLLCLVGLLTSNTGVARWIYSRAAVLQGEVWRLLTGQLVHIGPRHLAWDLAALLLVTGLLGHLASARRWLAILITSLTATGLGLLFLSPTVMTVAGSSALIHGLFAGAAGSELRRGRKGGWLLLGALVAKLGWELAGPASAVVTGLGGGLAVDAHLYGAIGGLLAGLWPSGPTRRGEPHAPPPGQASDEPSES